MPELAEELDKQTRDEITEYQNLQQQIQLLLLQRQQVMAALAELGKAQEEVDKSAVSGAFYRFVGAIAVPKKKEELKKELKEEKESLELRRDVFQKQEHKMRERFDALRKNLEAKLGGGSSGRQGAGARDEGGDRAELG